jgi:hypothetical protein
VIELDLSKVWTFACDSIACELAGVPVIVATDEVECGGCNITARKSEAARLESVE